MVSEVDTQPSDFTNLPDGKVLYTCPVSYCRYRLVITNERSHIHKCPMLTKLNFGWSVTIMIVEKLWAQLDAAIDQVVDRKAAGDTGVEFQQAQGAARALSNALVLFMTPVFSMSQEVAKEGMRRRKARETGDTSYETPGMKHARYQTLTDGSTWYPASGGYTTDPKLARGEPRLGEEQQQNRAKANLPAVVKDSIVDLPHDLIANVKMASQVLSPDEIARANDLTIGQVRKILLSVDKP